MNFIFATAAQRSANSERVMSHLLSQHPNTNLVHVGENKEAQLLSHVHGVHSKVVLQPGDGDESVQLK